MSAEELPKLITASDKEIWAQFVIALLPIHVQKEPGSKGLVFIDMNGVYGTADMMFLEMQARCGGEEATYGLGGKGE